MNNNNLFVESGNSIGVQNQLVKGISKEANYEYLEEYIAKKKDMYKYKNFIIVEISHTDLAQKSYLRELKAKERTLRYWEETLLKNDALATSIDYYVYRSGMNTSLYEEQMAKVRQWYQKLMKIDIYMITPDEYSFYLDNLVDIYSNNAILAEKLDNIITCLEQIPHKEKATILINHNLLDCKTKAEFYNHIYTKTIKEKGFKVRYI